MASSTAVEAGGAAPPLKSVLHRVQQAAERSGRNVEEIRVVAASKTKSVSALRQVYDAGHRCFGENYVQELLQKAPQVNTTSLSILSPFSMLGFKQLPDYIEWHLIGNLQSNKVKPLIAKFGVEPAQCVDLVKHITNCPNLEFCGLMTIGMLDYTSTPENFKTLSNCRSEVCKALGIPETQCELSMGMTADFEQAIEMGSTTVRNGTAIFGPREYPLKKEE